MPEIVSIGMLNG